MTARRAASTNTPSPELLGISQAATECGVSERALRYYQQIGLLTPSGKTPGGMRRYSDEDLARVRRIRELQSLLGFNLDEIRTVLASDDRLAAIRAEYEATSEGSARRTHLLRQALQVREDLVATVDAKIAALEEFRSDLTASMNRVRGLLAGAADAPSDQNKPDQNKRATSGR